MTIREGEERGMCSAVMIELLPMVLSRKSTIRRRAIVKTSLRKDTFEEMRVVTNDKHIEEQIVKGNLLHSEVENFVISRSQVGKFGRQLNSKGIVINRPKVGEFGRQQNFEEHLDEWRSREKRSHGEECRDE